MAHVTANGISLHYELSGREGAPVVAFSNSLGTSLHMWDAVRSEIAKTFRVLRYDTRGHGGSSVADRPAMIEDLADDLLRLLDALEIPQIHLAGLSLGGMTGQSFAARYPDRIISLTLMATSAHLPPAQGWYDRARAVRDNGMASITDSVMTRWFTPAFATRAPDAYDAVRTEFVRMNPEGYARACEVIAPMDLRPALAAIRCPTLVIAGANDPATPVEHSQDLNKRIPGSQLMIVNDAAHLLAVEQPQATTTALLTFLQKRA